MSVVLSRKNIRWEPDKWKEQWTRTPINCYTLAFVSIWNTGWFLRQHKVFPCSQLNYSKHTIFIKPLTYFNISALHQTWRVTHGVPLTVCHSRCVTRSLWITVYVSRCAPHVVPLTVCATYDEWLTVCNTRCATRDVLFLVYDSRCVTHCMSFTVCETRCGAWCAKHGYRLSHIVCHTKKIFAFLS